MEEKMARRLLVRLPLILLLLLISGFGSCKDPYGACEKGGLAIANGITAGMKTTDQLRVQGLISTQEETNILGYLKFANDANGAFAACAQAAHSAGSVTGSYTSCAQTFSNALAAPSELALLHVTNPQSQQNVQVLANSVVTGVTGIITALGGK
jgi:hypothetical protein